MSKLTKLNKKKQMQENTMKTFIILTLLLIISTIANADYSIQHAYNLKNIESISGPGETKIIVFSGNELAKDSRGNTSKGKCLVNVKDQIISVDCEAQDQDGDIIYSNLYRDMSKGPNGVRKVLGGTGKYENSNDVCNYQVEMIDVKLGIAYLSGQCKE
jgi:hypothetical protein